MITENKALEPINLLDQSSASFAHYTAYALPVEATSVIHMIQTHYDSAKTLRRDTKQSALANRLSSLCEKPYFAAWLLC